MPVSKWAPLIEDCFAANGIKPGNGEQAVIFTEYATPRTGSSSRLDSDGFTCEAVLRPGFLADPRRGPC